MDIKLKDIFSSKTRNFSTDRLTMSFGEIINMYKEEEIIINPNFQRAFRWDKEKQTALIESILLGIPIPPIFVAENSNGQWELVDGLQRVSTILSFFGELKTVKDKNNLTLEEGKIIKELKGLNVKSLSLRLKLLLKRASVGVEILNRNNNNEMKYELFKRLNTTSEPLSEQEMRNAIFSGKFNTFIQKIASNEIFIDLMKPTKRQQEEMYLEELVLRYFAFKNSLDMAKGVKSHLDNYMQQINEDDSNFDYKLEESEFIKIIGFIHQNFGRDIFKAKNGHITKNLYDSLTYVLREKFDKYQNDIELFRKNVDILKNDDEYKKITDKKRESRTKDRILRALEIF